MTNRNLPVFSALLGIFASLVMLLPQSVHNVLYFDHAQFSVGSYLGVISGHWVHADWEHLGWNVLALVILAAIIEYRSRRLLLSSIFAGMLIVDLLLFSPLSSIQRYCGLSGMLNTMLGIVLICYWRETRSVLIPAFGLLCIAKIVVELHIGSSIITNISWPPYAMAHVAGLLGTPLAWYLGVKPSTCNVEKPALDYVSGNSIG